MTKRLRRANGEGSVYRRPDGRHVATAYDVNGKRVEFYGRTESEALDKRKRAADRLATGAAPVDSTTRLRTFYDRWETGTLAASGRRLATQSQYRSLLTNHALPVLGNRGVGGIRPSDVEQLFVSVSGRLAPSSCRSLYAALRALFDGAVRDGLIARNPVAAIRRPTLPRREAPVVERVQLRALLEAAKGTRLEALWLLLAGTGMRRGEALGLLWSDVDLDGGRLRVSRTLGRVDGVGIVVNEPKSGRGRRTLDLAPAVVAALREHRRRQAAERLAAGHAWADENRVFATTIGTALDPRGVNKAFGVIARKAKVSATPHTLRHTAATNLLDEGHPVAVVAEQLGQDPVTLMSTYAHALPTGRKAAADALGALLG